MLEGKCTVGEQGKEDRKCKWRVCNTLSLKDKPKSRIRSDFQWCSSKLHSIAGKMRKIILCLNENCIKFDNSKLPRNIQLIFHISSPSPFSKLLTQMCYMAYLQRKIWKDLARGRAKGITSDTSKAEGSKISCRPVPQERANLKRTLNMTQFFS